MRGHILNCRRCPLHATCRTPVPFRGTYPNPIAVVGEAPGELEDRKGQPFIGPAGRLLAEALSPFIDLDSCFICNVVCCRPKNNDLAAVPWAIRACRPNFLAQLTICNPTFILALGATALNVFSPGAKITHVHGRAFGYRFAGKDRIVFPTYHPAAAMRSPEWHTDMALDLVCFYALTKQADPWEDVRRPEPEVYHPALI